MSAIEETKTEISVQKAAATRVAPSPSVLTRLLNLLSSVRFGVTLLVLLVVASMIGMLIMQVNVEGFDKYYAELTPSQKLLYRTLGFFDIYHVWYFNVLLLVLSLNIVLASIDRFPKAWTFISRPKLDASAHWLRGQEQHEDVRLVGEGCESATARVVAACRAVGFKTRVTEKNGKTFVFAERGAWNRLGAYAVHVALLTIFLGGFLTAQFGRTGQMPLKPGTSSAEMVETVFGLDPVTGEFVPTRATTQLPFQVTATDIQQKLIKKEGPLTADNTLDWLTRIKIKDEFGEREGLVHLNNPYDYRGYRFFQASFINVGRARNVTVRVTPQNGGEPVVATIPRKGSTTLPDGTRLDFEEFLPDGKPTTQSGEYENPAARLLVTPPGGESQRAMAYAAELPADAPIAKPVAGYKFKLVDFEKVADAHVLSIQKDPGATVFYIGGALLTLTLCAVFFFSHQRVWALVEERGEGLVGVVLGGNTNRNAAGLEERFKRLVAAIDGKPQEVSNHE